MPTNHHGLNFKNPDQAAFGMWSGGHFKSIGFGQDIGSSRLIKLIQKSYESGVRTFLTADVYNEGHADEILGQALAGLPRDSYCLVGAIGHDFYTGSRDGEKGFPRFTDPALRTNKEYKSYLKMAAEKSLHRLGTDHFDLLMLHNPDSIGYSSAEVWQGMAELKEHKLTARLGVAPGPANGFTLDIISCFEKYGDLIDWAMIILNPLEPWPGKLCLPAAEKFKVDVITRVLDYGGLFHDDLKPGIKLPRGDHRSFRPSGWIEAAQPKLERFREIAINHDMTLLQLAARWALAQSPVKCVIPTLVQEVHEGAKAIETQLQELAEVSKCPSLTESEIEEINTLGDNSNCMSLKGASSQYLGEPQGDQWQLTPELLSVAQRWKIQPDKDLYYAGDPRDIREKGMPVHGAMQTSTQRLYCQLQVFSGCRDHQKLVQALKNSSMECVLYSDANDPQGVAVLVMTENPEDLTGKFRELLNSTAFSKLTHRPEMTMIGRTYSSGREMDLNDWLLHKPRRNALNPKHRWAIWYPLRRKGEFALLSEAEQGKILFEHAMIGRNYGAAGYAQDIRLACYGLDTHDNEFVLGVVGPELYPLSHLIQEMRKTQQTAKFIANLGPFFVGQVIWQASQKK